ncbi:MAG: amidohydrolase family protein [Anaerolineales bacterium]
MKRTFAFLLCALMSVLTACSSTPTPTAPPPLAAPIIFHSGVILTMEQSLPQAQAIAIADGTIVAVGDNASILGLRTPETQVIDLQGRALMPGFVDAHTHVLNDARSMGKSLDQAQMLALRNGITTLGDLYVDQRFLWQMQDFAQQGQLRVRTSLYLVYNDPCGRPIGNWYKNYPPTRNPGEMLRIGGIKIFTDGGSCGHVALSFDHADQKLGDLWLTQAELNNAVAEAQAAGYQVAIHAIGDRAVEQAQTAIAFALNGQPNTYRHRMEHVSVLRPEQVARFGELGIVPVLPGQYPSCTPFGPPLPEAYGEWEWPWAELRAQNPTLPIAWHSDYPFWSLNPFVHLYGFVTRQDVYQYYTCSPQAWLKDDVLIVEQALSIMTLESAYALFREEEVGSLRPGKYADLIVLSDNPLTVKAEDLRRITVLATLVNGRFEYCTPQAALLCPDYSARTPIPLPDYQPPQWISWVVMAVFVIVPLGFGVWQWRDPATARRWSGLAGMVGGAALILWIGLLEIYWEADRWQWLAVVVALGFATGSLGVLRLGRLQRLAWLGASLMVLGGMVIGIGVVVNWLENAEVWWISLLGLLGHALGLMLFGVYNLRARSLPRLNFLPLGMGVLGGLLPLIVNFFVPINANWIFAIAFGGGWVVLGAVLWLARVYDGKHRTPTNTDKHG